jgi:hypothetical protein
MGGSIAQPLRHGPGEVERLRLHLHAGLLQDVPDHHMDLRLSSSPRQLCLPNDNSFRGMHTVHKALGRRRERARLMLERFAQSHIWVLWGCRQHRNGPAVHCGSTHLYCEGATSEAYHLGRARCLLMWPCVSLPNFQPWCERTNMSTPSGVAALHHTSDAQNSHARC